MLLNTGAVNTSPTNAIIGYSEGPGDSYHELMVSGGEAESGPFVVEGASYHDCFQCSGSADTPSVFVGESFLSVQECAGTISQPSYGTGNCAHLVQRSSGWASAASSAIGASAHALQRSSGIAETGASCFGSSSHGLFISSGSATSSDPSVIGSSVMALSICRGVAGSATDTTEYLQFNRDVISVPVDEAPTFTILQFERQ